MGVTDVGTGAAEAEAEAAEDWDTEAGLDGHGVPLAAACVGVGSLVSDLLADKLGEDEREMDVERVPDRDGDGCLDTDKLLEDDLDVLPLLVHGASSGVAFPASVAATSATASSTKGRRKERMARASCDVCRFKSPQP